jgi:hypothetical protein
VRAILNAVGEGEWHWHPLEVTAHALIWELVHPGTKTPVNVFAFGPPLSLHARAIAALHPDALHEASQAQWAAQEAGERLVVAQSLLQTALMDLNEEELPEQRALLERVVQEMHAAMALLAHDSPALDLTGIARSPGLLAATAGPAR